MPPAGRQQSGHRAPAWASPSDAWTASYRTARAQDTSQPPTVSHSTPESSCIPGAQVTWRSLPWLAGSACAARRDAELSLRRSPWRPLSRIGRWFPACWTVFPPAGLFSRLLELGACAQRVPGASPTQSAVTPPAYKEQHWGCSSQSLPRFQTDSSPLACFLVEFVPRPPLDPDLCLPRNLQ